MCAAHPSRQLPDPRRPTARAAASARCTPTPPSSSTISTSPCPSSPTGCNSPWASTRRPPSRCGPGGHAGCRMACCAAGCWPRHAGPGPPARRSCPPPCCLRPACPAPQEFSRLWLPMPSNTTNGYDAHVVCTMHYGYTYFLQLMFIILCFIILFQVGRRSGTRACRAGKHVLGLNYQQHPGSKTLALLSARASGPRLPSLSHTLPLCWPHRVCPPHPHPHPAGGRLHHLHCPLLGAPLHRPRPREEEVAADALGYEGAAARLPAHPAPPAHCRLLLCCTIWLRPHLAWGCLLWLGPFALAGPVCSGPLPTGEATSNQPCARLS